MDASTRHLVRLRANDRCEYCRLPQSAAIFLAFHVEHVHAQQHVTDDSPGNLALACPDCNRHKGPTLSSIDPESRAIVPLFNPRIDQWDMHFQMRDALIIGLSPTGRATARLLRMNDEERLEMRIELLANGDW